jgi:hypothetical protein
LETAERAHRTGERYWQADEDLRAAWRAEIALLADALDTESDEEAAGFAREFLEAPTARRMEHQLDEELVDYERQLEWEEGLATDSR